MARYRGSARDAGKHSGEQFGQGFKYRDPELIDIEFGPWNRVGIGASLETVEDKGYLSTLKDGIIRDGRIVPIFGDNSVAFSSTDTAFLGMFEVTVGTTSQLLTFGRTVANTLIVYSTSGASTTSNTYAGIAVTTSDTIRGFQWGDYFYFGSPGIATGLVRYAITTPAINEPATAHTALYDLFLIDNNAVSVEFISASSTWLVSWSIDGNPEDWTGAGSGSKSYYDARYLRGVPFSRYGMMIFDSYVERIEATGVADPTFAFSRLEGVSGGYNRDSIASFANHIVYLNAARQLVVIDGDKMVVVDHDTDVYAGQGPIMFALKQMNLLMLSFPTSLTRVAVFYDIDMRRVGQYNGPIKLAATYNDKLFAYYVSAGTNYCVSNELVSIGSSVSTITSPQIWIGIHDIGEGAILEYVEIIARRLSYPTLLDMLVYAYQDSGATMVPFSGYTQAALPTNYGGRYYINAAGRAFAVNITDGTWDNSSAIEKVVLRIRRQKLIP